MLILLMLACAWASPITSTLLYREDGEVARCPSESRDAHDTCVRDRKSLGFQEVPKVYWGVALAKEPPPLRAVSIAIDSPAAASGLLAGDLILELDGRPVRRLTDVFAVPEEKRPGDKLDASIEREGRRMAIQSVLRERHQGERTAAP
jgi:C-terminal processing protease CtpA/Prc